MAPGLLRERVMIVRALRSAPRPRRHRLAVTAAALAAALVLAGALAGSPAAARQGEERDPGFGGRERVTAVDLVVESGRGLEAGGLEVTEDGRPLPVVAVERPGEGEPWRLVVWFELPLAEAEGVRWAADALAARAADLVELGAVEIVVTDPEPRTVLPPGRDAEALARALAGIAEDARAGDELVRLRRAVARELAAGAPAAGAVDGGDAAPGAPAGGEPAALARSAAAEEARFVAERADALIVRLVEIAAESEIGARRALLLVASGWDLEPAAFYRARLAGGAGAAVEPAGGRRARREPEAEAGSPAAGGAGEAGWPPGTGTTTEALARTLAAYGWVTLALAPPVPEEPEWHLRRRAEVALDHLHRPDAGEAYLGLGQALAAQGELERAVEVYRDAIHAFYDHPASAARQALAEAELGDVLARLARHEEAERWWRKALARDPALAARYPGAAAALAAPRAPLAALAEATAGRLVRDDPERPGALEAALASLEDRVRITYQRPGPPDGGLHPVAVRRTGGERPLPAPAWARAGTPETVAAARLRRLLATGDAAGATLAVTAGAGPAAAVTVRLVPPADGPLADPDHQPVLRASLAALGPDGETALRHRNLGPASLAAGEPWSYRFDAAGFPPGHEPAAVLVEDLATGLWGFAVVQRRAGASNAPGVSRASAGAGEERPRPGPALHSPRASAGPAPYGAVAAAGS